jgi:hypothetical protein
MRVRGYPCISSQASRTIDKGEGIDILATYQSQTLKYEAQAAKTLNDAPQMSGSRPFREFISAYGYVVCMARGYGSLRIAERPSMV